MTCLRWILEYIRLSDTVLSLLYRLSANIDLRPISNHFLSVFIFTVFMQIVRIFQIKRCGKIQELQNLKLRVQNQAHKIVTTVAKLRPCV